MAGVKRVELLNRGWQLKGLPYVQQLWGILPELPYFQGQKPARQVAAVVRETLEAFTTSDSDVVRAEHLPKYIPYLKQPPDYVQVTQQLWDAIVSGAVPGTNRVSVSHNVYLKMFVADLVHPERGAGMELPGGPFDVILVDEAQDINPVTLQMLMSRNTTIILVGDRHQHIYSFNHCCNALKEGKLAQRGLHHGPVSQFSLSSSFRLGEEVAEVANRVLWQLGERRRPLVGARRGLSAVYRPVMPVLGAPAAAGNDPAAAAGGGPAAAAGGGPAAAAGNAPAAGAGDFAAGGGQAGADAAALAGGAGAMLLQMLQHQQALETAPQHYEQVDMLHRQLQFTDSTPQQLECVAVSVMEHGHTKQLGLARPPVNPRTGRRYPLWYLTRYNRTWMEVAVGLVRDSAGLAPAAGQAPGGAGAGAGGGPKLYLTAETTLDGKIRFLEDVLGVFRFLHGQSRSFRNYTEPAELLKAAAAREDRDLQGAIDFAQAHGADTEALVAAVYGHWVRDREASDFMLGTCYKAKGQEDCFVQLADDFAPVADGPKPDVPRDELNLVYVALTRAKVGLVLNNDLWELVEDGSRRLVGLKVRQPAQQQQPGAQDGAAAGGAGQPGLQHQPATLCCVCGAVIEEPDDEEAADEPGAGDAAAGQAVVVTLLQQPMCAGCARAATIWGQCA